MATILQINQILVAALNLFTGLSTIKINTFPKPATEFVTYQVSDIKDLSFSEEIAENGNLITTFLKMITYSVNIYSKTAIEKAETVKKKFETQTGQSTFLSQNIGITKVSNAKDLTFIENDYNTQRAQFDVILNYTSTETEDLGFFNKVELSSTQEPLKTYIIAKLEG